MTPAPSSQRAYGAIGIGPWTWLALIDNLSRQPLQNPARTVRRGRVNHDDVDARVGCEVERSDCGDTGPGVSECSRGDDRKTSNTTRATDEVDRSAGCGGGCNCRLEVGAECSVTHGCESGNRGGCHVTNQHALARGVLTHRVPLELDIDDGCGGGGGGEFSTNLERPPDVVHKAGGNVDGAKNVGNNRC